MNKKKVILILILGALVIVSLIAILVSAKPKENGSLDALTQTTEQESQTEDVDINTETEPSSEPETITESESEDIVFDESETSEFTEPEPDSEELAKIDEIDKKNKEIFAKNKELPTVVSYSGVDVSEAIGIDDFAVGGLFYQDEATRDNQFIFADGMFSDILACIIQEPITNVKAPDDMTTAILTYDVESASHTYEIRYDAEEHKLSTLYMDERYWFRTLSPEEAETYAKNLDDGTTSGCDCGCGTDDSVSSCTTGSECGGNSSDCGV